MKIAMKKLRAEVARVREIAVGLHHQSIDDRAVSREKEADRLQEIVDSLENNYLKWKNIFRQY